MILLVFCAVLNYHYLYFEYQRNANIHEQRINIVEQHSKSKIKQEELVLPKLRNRSAAGYELNDQEYVMRGFKNYYRIYKDVTILLK
jgi:hypothetical protein